MTLGPQNISKVNIQSTHIECSLKKCQLSTGNLDNLVISLYKPGCRCQELLVERRFSVVLQHDFYPYVWGSGGISVMMLYQCIGLLRKALKVFKVDGSEKMVSFSIECYCSGRNRRHSSHVIIRPGYKDGFFQRA